MIKKIFGNRLSTIVGYLRNFVRQIKIVEKGKYYIMNSKMRVVQVVPKHGYVDDGLMTNHVTDFLYDEKFMNAYKEGKKLVLQKIRLITFEANSIKEIFTIEHI